MSKLRCRILGHQWHEVGRELVEAENENVNKTCKYHFICLNCKDSQCRTINFMKPKEGAA